jgi:hypothetical protein
MHRGSFLSEVSIRWSRRRAHHALADRGNRGKSGADLEWYETPAKISFFLPVASIARDTRASSKALRWRGSASGQSRLNGGIETIGADRRNKPAGKAGSNKGESEDLPANTPFARRCEALHTHRQRTIYNEGRARGHRLLRAPKKDTASLPFRGWGCLASCSDMVVAHGPILARMGRGTACDKDAGELAALRAKAAAADFRIDALRNALRTG